MLDLSEADAARARLVIDSEPQRHLEILATARRNRLLSNGRPRFDLTDDEIKRSTEMAMRLENGDQVDPETAELPEGWRTLDSGTPAPNWVAAVDEARRVIDLDPDLYHGDMAHAAKADASLVKRRREAAEELRGMFAHVAPGTSLADELIADRRAEVRAEERAEAERQRAGN